MTLLLTIALLVGLVTLAVYAGSALVDLFGLVGALLLFVLIAWMLS